MKHSLELIVSHFVYFDVMILRLLWGTIQQVPELSCNFCHNLSTTLGRKTFQTKRHNLDSYLPEVAAKTKVGIPKNVLCGCEPL